MLIGSAGTETVARMLGWAALTLDNNPDQRAELAADPEPHPERRGRAAPLRGAVTGAEPLVHRGRRGARRHHPGQLEGRHDHRLGRPRTSGPTRTRTASTSTGSSTTTCPSATASTSAWGRRWPGRRGGSPWRRPSSASPSGRWTWTRRCRSTPAPSGATRSSRSAV